MSAYRHALVVDNTTSSQHLTRAAQALEHGAGTVLLNGIVALRSTPSAILCEVIDPTPDAHRCAEEFKVLIENAGRELNKSALAQVLSSKPLRWKVVNAQGNEPVELWPATT